MKICEILRAYSEVRSAIAPFHATKEQGISLCTQIQKFRTPLSRKGQSLFLDRLLIYLGREG